MSRGDKKAVRAPSHTVRTVSTVRLPYSHVHTAKRTHFMNMKEFLFSSESRTISNACYCGAAHIQWRVSNSLQAGGYFMNRHVWH